MTTTYKFVPEHIAVLVEDVCKSLDLVCVNIRKEGVYSGYFATISDGTTTNEKFIPYDYGQMLQEADRPALLASELTTLFGIVPSEVVEAVNDVTAEAESEPQPPTKPRKRAK